MKQISITESSDYLDAMETYAMFRKQYRVEKAVEKTLDDLYDSDPDCEPFIWLGLASAQMRRHELIPRVAEMAEKSIDGAQARYAGEGYAIPARWVTAFFNRLRDPKNLCTPEKAAMIPRVPESPSKPWEYRCKWEIGDIYAFRMKSDAARKAGLYGKYIILRKMGERKDDEECVKLPVTAPVVYLTLSDQCEGLAEREALEKLGYLRVSDMEQAGRFEYRVQIIIIKEAVLKRAKLVYIGNCKDALTPNNELYLTTDNRYKDDSRIFCGWPDPWPFENLEKFFINRYLKYDIYHGPLEETPSLAGLESNEH